MTRGIEQFDPLLGDWASSSKTYPEGRGRMTVAPTEDGKFVPVDHNLRKMASTGRSTSTSTTRKSAEVDAYIAAAPERAQPLLRRIRAIINENAPRAEERISYRMPYYHYLGRLVYFGVHTNHVGLYALGQTHEAEGLGKYVAAKGTLQFRFDEKLPEARIAALIRKRVRENEATAAAAESARRSASTRSKR